MEIAVHVFNVSEPKFAQLYASSGNYSPENLPTTSHGVKHLTPAKDIVAMILHAAGGSRIKVLRTVAHGNSGVYQFPDLWNVNLISSEYERLKGVFASNARFEMHGCGLASETDILKPGTNINDANQSNTVPGTFIGRSSGRGLTYLRRVAVVFGVPVVAGVDVQFVTATNWSFEGDTVTVYPNGKFVMDSEGTRVWDVEARERAAKAYLARIIAQSIAPKQFAQARVQLKELMRLYPKTYAARDAEDRLQNDDLQPSPPVVLPDGSRTL